MFFDRKGPVTLCNVLSNLSRETSCWRIAQCNMGCLAIFLLREALHGVELSSTFRNGLQQLATPSHSVSPLQQLFLQFYGSFNNGACHSSCFSFWKALPDKLLRKLHSVTGPSGLVKADVSSVSHSSEAMLVATKFDH